MVDTTVITTLVGSGVAGVFCILFILDVIFPRTVVNDLKEEVKELKEELVVQRERADTAIAALSASRDVIAALREGLEVGRSERGHHV